MPEPSTQPTPAPGPQPAPAKKSLTGWKLVAFILLLTAGVGRLFLYLLMHHPAQNAGALPTWPVKSGDVFPIKPGDAQIAHWAAQPDNDGFIAELIAQNGQQLTPRVCALQPDYITSPGQPGGSLTVLSQARPGEWRLRWQGGDTIPGDGKPEQIALNCGHDATLLMTSAELLSWLKMQTGEPDEYPVMSNNMMYLDLPPDTTQPPAETTPAPAPAPKPAPPAHKPAPRHHHR